MNPKLRTVDYKNKTIYIGLDVHKKNWHATLIIEDIQIKKSFVADPSKFAFYLQSNYPNATFKVAYEAGCFGFWIKEALDKLGIETIVVNPADIPSTDKEDRNKTDPRDSRKIALSLNGQMLTGIYAPSREAQEHRLLIRRRQDMSKKSTRIKNQIKALLKFFGIQYPIEYENKGTHWSKQFLKWLSEIQFQTRIGKMEMEGYLREINFIRSEILILTRQIRELSKNEKYSEKCKLLQSIPGIGVLGSMTVLLEIIDIERFKKRDEFLSYIGLVPTEHSSGEKRKIGHMNRRCNSNLRTIFIEAAWIAIRKDPALTLYFNDCVKKGTKTSAIIKVAKKLANRMRFVLLHNQKYVYGLVA